MKKVTENGYRNEAVKRANTKSRVLLPLVVAAAFLAPSQVSADWSFEDFKTVAAKVVKKVALPVTATVHGVASAAEAYSDGHSASEIVGYGLGGAAAHIGNNIAETANDIATITEVAVDAYNEN